jgi:hypothetical protein
MPVSLPPILALLLAATVSSARRPGADPELGLVRWGRDLDAALATSRASGRPVLVLFDEVPGCATCVGFGQEVLSHPLLVEAIEHEFVPVFVANNRSGREAELLARFGEPAWNNPVVRLLDANGRDLLPRRDGLYSAHEIAARLVEALRAARRLVPGYLAIAEAETQHAHRREATFAMGCFWEGEARLGTLPGVLDVRAVHTDRGEGVRVTYDASRLTPEALAKAAAERSCAFVREGGSGTRDAGGSDHRHALAASPLRKLALTPMQAMRVNSALAAGADGHEWLTPSQREEARGQGAGRK